MRHFCTAGPIQSDIHYAIDPLERIERFEATRLIDERKYFVVHAPRQTGKTSSLLALVHHLNQTGRYRALYVNVESAQGARENVSEAMSTYSTSWNARHAGFCTTTQPQKRLPSPLLSARHSKLCVYAIPCLCAS